MNFIGFHSTDILRIKSEKAVASLLSRVSITICYTCCMLFHGKKSPQYLSELASGGMIETIPYFLSNSLNYR